MNHHRLLRASLSILLVLVLLVPPLAHFSIRKVDAGMMTNASLTISNSRAGQTGVTYDFAMSATDSASLIKQVDIYFCTNATGVCSAPTGMDMGTPTGSTTIAGAGGGETLSLIAAAANTARVVITTPAAESPTDFTMQFTGVINTTSVTSVYARVTTYSDAGTTILDTVTVATAVIDSEALKVTADVGPVFTFSIAANNAGSVNGKAINVTSEANTIPFGTLTNGAEKVASHEISVATNATNGYQVTVKTLATPPLVSGSDNIDQFTGTNNSPTAWSTPNSSTPNTNTGFFGYTTEDTSLTVVGDGANRFGSDEWAGFTTSAAEVAYNTTAPNGTETTKLGWQAEVDNFQPAGTYTGDVIIVATPTY